MNLNPLPSQNRMYRALIEKDRSFEGIFFVGVKTTGIFCRPSCRARKPKKENVEFFATSKDALSRGYRPCRVCTPMSPAGETPKWLQKLIAEASKDPSSKFSDSEIKKRGIDPNRARRWFKKHHGMTFQAYLRSLRIGRSFGRLHSGEKVIESAFQSGYESLSGFTSAFKKTLGKSPTEARTKGVIHICQILSPLGPLLVGSTDEGICLLEFTDRRMLETQLKTLEKRFNRPVLTSVGKHVKKLKRQLDEYFSGKRKKFDIPLVTPGTQFQEKVWAQLQTIPYGKTRSYKEQAIAIKNKKAVRAVARSNGENRIAILIPCHRVIGSDGNLTGYGGGLWRKKALLDLEQKNT